MTPIECGAAADWLSVIPGQAPGRLPHNCQRPVASAHFAAAWSCVLDCKVNSTGVEVSVPSPEKVMVPLTLIRSRDSTRQPASRSKNIVASEDSTFRAPLVALSGDGALGSSGGHVTSRP